MAVESEEKARMEAVKKSSDRARAIEEARRKAHADRAKTEPNLIVHGPART